MQIKVFKSGFQTKKLKKNWIKKYSNEAVFSIDEVKVGILIQTKALLELFQSHI